VLTAGLYDRFVKLQGSVFHGREPDENRWNFDLGGSIPILGEAQVDLDGRNVPFARLEYVVKPAGELVVPGNATYGVASASSRRGWR
jgi:hypothetical protein